MSPNAMQKAMMLGVLTFILCGGATGQTNPNNAKANSGTSGSQLMQISVPMRLACASPAPSTWAAGSLMMSFEPSGRLSVALRNSNTILYSFTQSGSNFVLKAMGRVDPDGRHHAPVDKLDARVEVLSALSASSDGKPRYAVRMVLPTAGGSLQNLDVGCIMDRGASVEKPEVARVLNQDPFILGAQMFVQRLQSSKSSTCQQVGQFAAQRLQMVRSMHKQHAERAMAEMYELAEQRGCV